MQINKFAPASISSEVIPSWTPLFTEISLPKVAIIAPEKMFPVLVSSELNVNSVKIP